MYNFLKIFHTSKMFWILISLVSIVLERRLNSVSIKFTQFELTMFERRTHNSGGLCLLSITDPSAARPRPPKYDHVNTHTRRGGLSRGSEGPLTQRERRLTKAPLGDHHKAKGPRYG